MSGRKVLKPLKANQQVQVDWIANYLRKGEPRSKILERFKKTWKDVGRSTFDTRLKHATALIQKEHKRIEREVERRVQKEIDARKTKILTSIERQEILSQIARGEIPLTKPVVVDKDVVNVPIVPDYMDRKNAINELNRMDGSHAPSKVAQTTTKGEDVMQPITEIKVVRVTKQDEPGG